LSNLPSVLVEAFGDVSTMADMDTKGGKRRNKRWPEALKREIVAATLAPGASVSVVARQYDVNANQVFGWRRLYREAGGPSPASSSRLVPVTVTPEPEDAPVAPSTPAALNTIEIEVSGRYRVRVGPGFEAAALRRVLDVLRRI
jgi:transposase